MTELPEDTCVAIVKITGYGKEGESRICMKERKHFRHQPHYWYDNNDCTCGNPGIHHAFVMGGRPHEGVKKMCEMFSD